VNRALNMVCGVNEHCAITVLTHAVD